MEFFVQKGRAEGLTFDTDLFAGGFVDSLFALEIVIYLENTFGLRIKNSEIREENFKTIHAMAALVERLKK